jgi:hypothetical protein
MAEDRPIIVSGADRMITVRLPNSTKTTGGSHTVEALTASEPFKMIVFTRGNKEEFRTEAAGNWKITIE